MSRNALNGLKCAVLVAGIVFVTGCSEKLTYDRWKTLTLQSSKMEVEQVLGDPNEYRKDDRWMYHNPEKQISVNVEFVGGRKITHTRWVDPKHGVHEMGRPAIEGTNLIERDTSKTDIGQE